MIDYEAVVEETFRKYQPIQTRSELIEAMKIVEAFKPKRIVELGVYRGGTLYPWTMCATDDAIVVGIDTPGTPPEVNENLQKWLKPEQRGLILLEDTRSPDTRDKALAFLGGQVDFLFIDADHRYSWVKADYDTWLPHVRSGGLIGFHDVRDNPPGCDSMRFFEDIRVGYKKSEVIYHPYPTGQGIGLLWVE